ncbi:uncharacterized protein zmp:0000000951 [Xyrauchen texanus]|uniref:uncharacterized protein zmp:0000000951 n=1 Tax=Xyrauchen texanus TaxID=154827 RepID=UPI0022427A0E|nr:uncharacterized protein zmp:0000000951 [Xyrauchen texanus]
MEGKLSDEKVKEFLAPWRFSLRAAGFEDRLLVALQLFEHFPLDIAVTGGTQEANAQLVSMICGLNEEPEMEEEEEEETEDEDDEEEVETDKEEDEDDEEDGVNAKEAADHQSNSRKHVRIAESSEYIGSGVPDFDSVILHRQIPNIRVWTVQGHPTSNSIIKRNSQQYDSAYYDVLVVLTTEERKEDHMWLKMELHERDPPFFLVKAEKEWDVLEEKPTGPCMTCAWERTRARNLEMQKRRKEAYRDMGDSTDSQNPSNASQDAELVEMNDIGEVLAKALPELKRKAFSQFLVAITKELCVPKLLTDETQFLVSTALRFRKIEQDDLDQIFKLSQPRDLTDHPSKLQTILTALDYFRLDIGVLGETGSGSSSLVNALLGLKNTEKQVAPTGVIETTKEAVAYPYTYFPNIRLWDLPGLGKIGELCSQSTTSSFNEAQNIASMLALCDVYIFVSPLRLRLGIIQLLQQASSLGKECYLVLSMADLIEERSVTEVKEWVKDVLGKLGLQQNFFLVSAHHPETLDFLRLKETLESAFPIHKKVAMARYAAKQLDEDVFWKRADPCKLM